MQVRMCGASHGKINLQFCTVDTGEREREREREGGQGSKCDISSLTSVMAVPCVVSHLRCSSQP